MYLIVSGSAKSARRLSARESFGEMASLDNMERSASVQAISDCTLLRIGASSAREMPAATVKTYRNIAMLPAQRLRYSHSLASLLPHKLPGEENPG